MVVGKITLSLMDLQEKIVQLEQYYMPIHLENSFNETKVIAIKKITYILKHSNRTVLQDCDFYHLLRCALTLVYYFGMRLKMKRLTSKYLYWCGKRQFHKAEYAFQRTMDCLLPECAEVTIKITLKFFAEVQLWQYENFIEQILEVVLYFSRGKITLFNLLLTDIHNVLFSDVKTARHKMRVIYELLKSPHWVIDKTELLPFVTRLLDYFAFSIAKGDNKIAAYGYLSKGFDVCLRRIFGRVENEHRLLIITKMLHWFSNVNIDDDNILEVSSLLDHAAELYEVTTYSDSFKDGMFERVFSNLLGSTKPLFSLVGCRLLQRFLDRQQNAAILLEPTLYYEFSQVRLKIGYYDSNDKTFIRRHRAKFHEYVLTAVKLHCSNAVNLKALFAIICTIVLEVPCGLTAAIASCIVMAIQDHALNGENLAARCRYWMHAVVISVMSLICWVHKAPVLYEYVNNIISRRAKEAPQFNPPLLQFYTIGRNLVTWNKPNLFFEDWELRYGLWKHFQDVHPKRKDREQKIKTKAPVSNIR